MKDLCGIAIVFLAVLATIRADTVELKTGEKIEGVFRQAGPAGAVIEVGGQALTFEMEKVRAIYFGAAPAAGQKVSSAHSDALDALNGLQSVTRSGVRYVDYAPRVLDAKIKVDKYLSSAGNNDGDLRTSLRLAMQYHELAATAWNAKIAKSFSRSTEVGRVLRDNPALRDCPGLQEAIAESDAYWEKRYTEPTTVGKIQIPPEKPSPGKTIAESIKESAVSSTGSLVGDRPNILWTCAASLIAQAEKQR